MKILLVEDNQTIAKGIDYSLSTEGYEVSLANTVREVIDYLKNDTADLIILDISLPDGDGLHLYEDEIKRMNIPTIFLTAKDDEETIVKGLTLGAEDYITKPFRTKELLVRIEKTLLRKNDNTIITVRDISFDLDKMVVYKGKERIEFTSLELKILHLLFLNLNKVVRRGTILDKIWDWTGNDVEDNTVTVYMKRIREKLGCDMIVTLKGIGYRIDANEK